MTTAVPPQTPPKATAGILVVEDDEPIAEALTQLLELEGYRVWHAPNGSRAEELLEQHLPDLVLLDIVLPDSDGLVLCSELRTRWSVPVVLLSGTRRKYDPIIGLRLGADDFIAKPFDARELLARVDAILRRTAASRRQAISEPETYRLGALTVDVGRRAVIHGERPLQLTPTEFRLLAALVSEPDRVFSREELANKVWGYESIGESRVVDVHIRRLRQKLDRADVVDPEIVTLRGFGYKLSRIGRA